MFACWLTCGYFNVFSNDVNKKMNKKALFLTAEVFFTPPDLTAPIQQKARCSLDRF